MIGCGGEKKETKDALAPNLEEAEPNNDLHNAQPVTHGTIVKGFIHEKMDKDYYKITIPPDSGAILKAELTGVADINLKMLLYDEYKEELLDVDSFKEGENETITNFTLKSGDTYLLVRELWLKANEKKFNDTLAYNLRIYFNEVTKDIELEPNNKAIKATTLIPDTTMKGYFSPKGDEDWYRLSLNRENAKYLQITLSGVENVDAKIKIYDPIEALIYKADKGGKGEGEKITNLGIDLSNEFYYVVAASAKYHANESTPYELSVRFIHSSHKTEIEPNNRMVKATEIVEDDSIFGFIDDSKDVDWYHIKRDVIESQIAKIEVKGIPKIDFKISLINDLEKTILSVDDTGIQEDEKITNIGLIGGEDYYIKLETVKKGANVEDQYSIVMQFSSYFGTEEFELNNHKESANPVEMDKAIAGYIHPIGDVDFYRLDLQHRYSGKLQFILEGIKKVNTNMELYDDSMNKIATAAAKPTEGIERILVDCNPGTYYIKVFDNDGKESNYRDKYQLAIFLKPL